MANEPWRGANKMINGKRAGGTGQGDCQRQPVNVMGRAERRGGDAPPPASQPRRIFGSAGCTIAASTEQTRRGWGFETVPELVHADTDLHVVLTDANGPRDQMRAQTGQGRQNTALTKASCPQTFPAVLLLNSRGRSEPSTNFTC